MTIKKRLILSLGIPVFIILVVGAIFTIITKSVFQKEASETALKLAHKAIIEIDKGIYIRAEELQIYARDISLAKEANISNDEFDKIPNVQDYINLIDKDWKGGKETPFIRRFLDNELSMTLAKHLEFYKQEYDYAVFSEIYVTNKYGVVIGSTGRTSDFLQADEEWYQNAIKEKEFWVGDVEYDESSDAVSIDIVVNLYDDNRSFVGILKTVLNIEDAKNTISLIQSQSQYKSITPYLVDKNGFVIFSGVSPRIRQLGMDYVKQFGTDIKLKEFGDDISYRETVARVIKGNDGFDVVKEDGKRLLSCFTTSVGFKDFKGLGWSLIVDYELDEILSSVVKLKNIIVTVFVIILIIAIVLGIYNARSISNPIIKLKDASVIISSGKLDTKVYLETKDELGQLAASFNKMIDDLSKSRGEIINRTMELEDVNLKLCHEIDEHKRTEKRLRILSRAIEQSPDSVLITDVKGNIEYVNPRFTQLTGYTPEETIGKNPSILKSGEQSDEVYKQLWTTITAGNEWHGRFQNRKKNGEIYWELQSISPVKDDNGAIINFVAVKIDDTELMKAEKMVHKANARLAEIMTISADAIISIDESMRIIAFNKGAECAFGYSSYEVIGQRVEILMPEWARKNHSSHVSDFSNSNETARRLGERGCKISGRRKNGEEFPAEASISQLKDDDGKKIFTAVLRDVTKRKELENKILEEKTELEISLKELDKAYGELRTSQAIILQQEKMASIGVLVAGIAHEINNPMGFISSNIGSLSRYVKKFTEFIDMQDAAIESLNAEDVIKSLDEKRKNLKLDYIRNDIKELVKESLDGADRIKKIVMDLKTFARPSEEGQQSANINECMESALNIVRNELKYKTAVKKEYGDIPMTICSCRQLSQVFMNMLINAAHAIDKQGEITIRTWHEADSIFVSISDTGCGIPEENLTKIFDPFFTTKEAEKGTGLGLSISYDIIKKHSGNITVRSEVGKGTTFTIMVPVKG